MLTLAANEMELLGRLKSVALDSIRVASCKQENVAGIDGFRCKAICFGGHRVITSGIALVDDEDLSDVEVLWVREADIYEIRSCETATPLAQLFPSQFQDWRKAGELEVAVLAAVSPRRRFWAPDQGGSVKHDAGLRLGGPGSEVFITPSPMPLGDLFLSAVLPSELDGSFNAI